MAIENNNPADAVIGELQYLKPGSGNALYVASQAGDAEAAKHEGEYQKQKVSIHNGRNFVDKWSLDIHGFRLVPHETKVNCRDDAELERSYNAEIVALLKEQIPGAAAVHVFDHTRRSSSSGLRTANAMREPSAVIHNDYSEWSANKRLKEIVGEEEAKKYSRFAIVNVWRPLCPVVETWPMTFCDSTTIDVERDIKPVERFSKDGRRGELQMAFHHPNHQWYYFPKMKHNEVALIKTYDSATDVNRYTLHTAFDEPCDPNVAPRESMETRTFVFFE